MAGREWNVCIDIGSTFTKGVLVRFGAREPSIAARAETPTVVADLTQGFETVRRALEQEAHALDPRFAPGDSLVRFSSSARGGLRIAAIGVVPDLTLAVARMAAASAGGKIVKSFAYRLTAEDVAALEGLDPDVILLTGGTDGGDEKHVLANATALARARIGSTIIYAGNRAAREDVARALEGKELVTVDNVMPEIDSIRVEPAREAVRRIFLEKIVEGKGLAALVRAVGTAPKPTPLAVLELVRALPEAGQEWHDVCVLDIGGATTDFYSYTEAFHGDGAIVLRGLREPALTRTVEGDLGLRVSARALYESGRELIERQLAASPSAAAQFPEYVERITARPEHIPAAPEEVYMDAVLARTCAALSARRHAGVLRTVYTATGKVQVQRGKDLRKVARVIGTGGYLARCADGEWFARACALLVPEPEEQFLLPEAPEVYADRAHVAPLLGSLAAEFPREAARLLVQNLERITCGAADEAARKQCRTQ